jgi:hypothetical protein
MAMSHMGQKRKYRRLRVISALPLEADIDGLKADICGMTLFF